ncbi:MPHOSPH10 [Cordylochernes scorpioides]|uniref:MPHOSPH10 n=1 Tax=Cordylochernes scorpioides TaxID=51811 RepID=A0ABY6K641_9ARAC|nr:MPHOSPH10 [Cordylochernes scorpioides]
MEKENKSAWRRRLQVTSTGSDVSSSVAEASRPPSRMEDFDKYEAELEAQIKENNLDLTHGYESEDEEGKPISDYMYSDFFGDPDNAEEAERPQKKEKKKLKKMAKEDGKKKSKQVVDEEEENSEMPLGEEEDNEELSDEDPFIKSLYNKITKPTESDDDDDWDDMDDDDEVVTEPKKSKKSVRFQLDEEEDEEEEEETDDDEDLFGGKKVQDRGRKVQEEEEEYSEEEEESPAPRKKGKGLVLGSRDEQDTRSTALKESSKYRQLEYPDVCARGARNIFAMQDSDDDSEDSDTPEYKRRERKFLETVRQKEEEALQEQDWKMKGEVDARSRDKDSMLEEHLQTKLPVWNSQPLTPEYMAEIHRIILQRCIDDVWDSPVRQVRPKENHYNYRKHKELNKEKSKKSLCAIYEEKLLAGQNLLKLQEDDSEQLKNIKTKMAALFKSVDALSQFHYQPRPQDVPASNTSLNMPAFTAEEAGPEIFSTVSKEPAARIANKKRKDLRYMTESTKSLKLRKRKQIGQKMGPKDPLASLNQKNPTKAIAGGQKSKDGQKRPADQDTNRHGKKQKTQMQNMEDFDKYEAELEAQIKENNLDLTHGYESEDEEGKPISDYMYSDFFGDPDNPEEAERPQKKEKKKLKKMAKEDGKKKSKQVVDEEEENSEMPLGEEEDNEELSDEDPFIKSLYNKITKPAGSDDDDDWDDMDDDDEVVTEPKKSKKSVRFQLDEEDDEEEEEETDDDEDLFGGKKKVQDRGRKVQEEEEEEYSEEEEESPAPRKKGKGLVLGSRDEQDTRSTALKESSKYHQLELKYPDVCARGARNIFAMQDSDDDSEDSDTPEYKRRERKFLETVRQKEEEALQEQDWKMKGEVDARSRDKDSMLEEHLQTKLPVWNSQPLTPEYMAEIHRIILQRCIDDVWDSPVRQVRPKENHYNYRKHKELNKEKSKKSLCAIYEEKLLAGQNLLKLQEDDSEQLKNIKTKMAALFKSVDALSQFHYQPRPQDVPASNTSLNMPAFTAEEAGPDIVSTVSREPAARIANKKRKDLRYMTESTKSLKLRKRKQIGQKMGPKDPLASLNQKNPTKAIAGGQKSKDGQKRPADQDTNRHWKKQKTQMQKYTSY